MEIVLKVKVPYRKELYATPPRLTTTAVFLAFPSQALFPIPLNYNSPLCDHHGITGMMLGTVGVLFFAASLASRHGDTEQRCSDDILAAAGETCAESGGPSAAQLHLRSGEQARTFTYTAPPRRTICP